MFTTNHGVFFLSLPPYLRCWRCFTRPKLLVFLSFLQCHTYLVSRETVVFLVMWTTWMSAVVGRFRWLGCVRTPVHMSVRLLFTYVCMWYAPTRSWSTGRTTVLLIHVQFWGSQHYFLEGEVCDDHNRTSQLHYVRSIASFMWFRTWTWHFAPSSLVSLYLLTRLSCEGHLRYLQLR
jgi:hypothetical protein